MQLTDEIKTDIKEIRDTVTKITISVARIEEKLTQKVSEVDFIEGISKAMAQHKQEHCLDCNRSKKRSSLIKTNDTEKWRSIAKIIGYILTTIITGILGLIAGGQV